MGKPASSGLISLEVNGEEQVKFSLGRMAHALADMRPFWPAFHEVFKAVEVAQFASQGGAGGGGAWAPLSAAYAAWKAVHYPGRPILVRSGALREAMTGGSGHIFEPTPTYVRLGGYSPYGGYHQEGDGVPQRKPIDISASQEQAFGRAVAAVARDLGMIWTRGGMGGL